MLYNFDANATLGLLPEVEIELKNYISKCFNPSSIHRGGQKSRALVEEARERVALLLNGDEYRVVFNSGATEANNTALWQAYFDNKKVFTSKIEHPCILETLDFLSNFNISTSFLELNKIRENSFNVEDGLYSLMWANNETGEIFDILNIAKRVKEKSPNSIFHTDAVQIIGKEIISIDNSGIDMLSLSGHKLGALSGVGALLVKRGFPFNSLIKGGTQQLHYRAGTENVFGIISLGIAASFWHKKQKEIKLKQNKCKNYILDFISNNLKNCEIISPQKSTCNTISLRVKGIKADDLVVAMDVQNYCISSGAACSSGKPNPSHVLLGLGLSEEVATQTIRISLSPTLTMDEVIKFCECLQTSLQNFNV